MQNVIDQPSLSQPQTLRAKSFNLWSRTRTGKERTAGETELLAFVRFSLVPVRRLWYPAMSDEGSQRRSIRLNGPTWSKRADGLIEWERSRSSKPPAEVAMLELHNYALALCRTEMTKRGVPEKYVATYRFEAWNLGSAEYPTLSVVDNDIKPVTIKNVSWHPKRAVAKGETPELDMGVLDYMREQIDVGGKVYVRYPPFITRWQFTAQLSKRQGRMGLYLIWKPTPLLVPEYQQLLLASEYHYSPSGEQTVPVWCHPEDAQAISGYLWLANRSEVPPPKYRDFPAENGDLMYVSRKPNITPTKVNVLSGALADFYTTDLLKRIAEFPEFFGFEPNTQEGLAGGYYYDMPSQMFHGSGLTYSTRSKRVHVPESALKAAEISASDTTVLIWVNPGGKLASSMSERDPAGFATELGYLDGALWSAPLDVSVKTKEGFLVFMSEEVTEKLKKKATDSGLPFAGQLSPVPFGFLKDSRPALFALAFKHHLARRSRQLQDDEQEDTTPAETDVAI